MKLSLVIPFYNESVNVTHVGERVLTVLRTAGIPHELLLVDNGSHDDTRQRIEALARQHPGVRLVVVDNNRGYGWGVLEGLRHATGEIRGFMVGDGQIPPEAVAQVYAHLLANRLAFCKAMRATRNDGWQRAWLTRAGNCLFRLCFPCIRTRDINGSPKLFTQALAERLQLRSPDWFLDAECVIKASLAGVPMDEVAVESPARASGRSNVRLSTVMEFVRNLAQYRWGGALAEWRRG